MAKTTISVPPTPVTPEIIGELDLARLASIGRNVKVNGWCGYAIPVHGGTLVYVRHATTGLDNEPADVGKERGW